MASLITLPTRAKKDSFCDMNLNLLLIAEEPLKTDKEEIFDSIEAANYLRACYSSKFKAINTHVTYIKDSFDLEFVRGIFCNILGYYQQNNQLDLSEFVLGFIGKKAFDAFVEQESNNQIGSTSLTLKFNQTENYIEADITGITVKPAIIPYIILPNLNEDYSEITLKLNSIDKINPKNPYSTTKEFLDKLKFIEELYDNGSLAYFKLDGKINNNTKKIEYLEVFERYTVNTLRYAPRDGICANDSMEEIKEAYKYLSKVLNKVPVHGKNIKEVLSLISNIPNVKILEQEDIDESPISRNSFEVFGSKKGQPSEWYNKWYNEVYSKHADEYNAKKLDNYIGRTPNKYEWIYDIEVFKYDWLFVAKTIDGTGKIICWNDPDKLRDWVKDKILIGFNNAGYDNGVIKYAMMQPYLIEGSMTVKEYSDDLILNDGQNTRDINFAKNSPIGLDDIPNFLSWDISFHMPFDIRRNSLKKLTMAVLDRKNYDSTVPFDIGRPLTLFERKETEKYCEMDVDNTRDLFLPDPKDLEEKEKNPKHKMREFARDSYDIRWNLIVEYQMKARTLINKAASFAGKLLCGEDAKPNKENTFKIVDGKKQYYGIPKLAYEELAGTELLNFYIKNQTNPDYIKEKFEWHLGGDDDSHLYQFGFGGLHQALIKFGSTNLINMDVASLYPSLLVIYGLMSRGAAKNPKSYEEVYHTRLKAKKEGKTLLNLGLKLILNGSVGAFLSEYNPLFDTWANSTICVYGQLLLYILAKRLFDLGCNIVQVNTDGIMIEKRDDVDYMKVCEEWQEQTKLTLEFDDIAILQQNNVNNYYCEFTNGKIKSKGFYLSNEKFGKATSKILCNLVTGKPPLEGTTPKDYVIFKRHGIGEIYDAKTRTKLEGRSLAFVVGYPTDKRTQEFYSRSRNSREVVKKDEKGKTLLDGAGKPITEIINTESKITGFTNHMLLVDDINNLTFDEINTHEYINFAKNLLDKVEDFGPYYDEGFVKTDEPAYLQALNPLKDNTDQYPTNAGVVCQNFLFECDYATKEEQEEMIRNCADKLYRVTWSGNKSYHCIVRLDKPVTATAYKKIWQYLQYKLGFIGADVQSGIPSKYTRVPGQINPKTGKEQTLYSFDKNVISCQEIIDNMPRIKEELKPVSQYKGKRTIEALARQIKRQDWSDGNRFAACQKLSPALVSLVDFDTLLNMIPVPLEKDHKYCLRGKRRYWEKYGETEEQTNEQKEIQ